MSVMCGLQGPGHTKTWEWGTPLQLLRGQFHSPFSGPKNHPHNSPIFYIKLEAPRGQGTCIMVLVGLEAGP